VVISTKDVASLGMAKFLREKYFKETEKSFGDFPVYRYGNAELIVIDTLHIHAQWLEEAYPSDLYIFASKHRAEKHVKTLSVHTTGNYGDALFGGYARTLSKAPALHMLSALKALKEERDRRGLPYDVTYEVTHHGPTFNTPTMFVEVGSTEEEWRDEEALKAAAEAIVKALEPYKAEKVAIGVGAGHYAPDFTRLALEENVAFGHMAPKYVADLLDVPMLDQMLKKTVPGPSHIKIASLPGSVKKMVKDWAANRGLELL